MAEHTCDPTVPVCSCGRKWTRCTTYSNGSRMYSDEKVYHAYVARFGKPPANVLVPIKEANHVRDR